ncbi:MAG: NusA-like transcription termination signal-binding factor [Candidatus Aenigmatarchaeota archaeon]
MREFDTETMQLIAAFEQLTGSEVRDIVKNESLHFLVNPGKAALAIGKGGAAVQNAEKVFKKQIRIYEWADQSEQFVRNLIPSAKSIKIDGEKAIVTVDSKERGAVIGRGGANINALRELLIRNSSLKELKVV